MKNDSWMMCLDHRVFNIITVKYMFPIPILYNLLYMIARSYIFSKIDLRNCIIRFVSAWVIVES